MKEQIKIIYQGGEGEIEEKKSRFIATIRPVESEDEALSFIAEMKKKYWDATHNCSAFIIGEDQEIMRASDDGEPSQTAGRPMLDVLLGEELNHVCAVVTRYFGGTLLGTGGLVRAYSRAVKEGLKNCIIITKCRAEELRIVTDYTDLGKIQYILGELNITILKSDYCDHVVLNILVPVSKEECVTKKLVEGTRGRCQIERIQTLYYGIVEDKIVLF